MVQEDEAKMEKLRRRNKILEEVSNNIRLLNEMLTHFRAEESSVSDMQAMKVWLASLQVLIILVEGTWPNLCVRQHLMWDDRIMEEADSNRLI